MQEKLDCRDFENWAVLYAAGELNDADRAAVEAHSGECAACAAVLAREKRLHEALAAREEPAEALDRSGLLLAQCRSEFAETLDDEQKATEQPLWRKLLSPGHWGTDFRRALAFHPEWSSAALLVVGALAGLGGRAWYLETSLPLPGKPLMTVSAAPRLTDQDLETMGVEGVRLEQQNGEAPRVEVQMFATRPLLVQGSPEDDEVQRVLTYVLAHPQRFGPGVRLDSLEALGTRVSDPEVRGALCQAARRDHNPAVRLKALEALQGVADAPDVLQAMVAALSADENSGVRIEAVNELLAVLGDPNAPAASLGPNTQDVLRDRMQNDPIQYIRMRSAAALERLTSLENGADGASPAAPLSRP